MEFRSIEELVRAFSKVRVLVIGDSMVDTYVYGRCERVSPEALVPVILPTGEENRLGGAANVAANLQSLGCEVHLTTVTGRDERGRLFKQLMNEKKLATDLVFVDPARPTTEKQRIFDGRKQVLRIDVEETKPIEATMADRIFKSLELYWSKIDVLLFQDYDKGLLTDHLIHQVMQKCNRISIPVVVDPKERNYFKYRGARLFKPNLREFRKAHNPPVNETNFENLRAYCRTVREDLQCDMLMLTLSADGLIVTDSGQSCHLPATKISLEDVSGAGDTVVALAAIGVALKLPTRLIGELANLAGGLVCQYEGVVAVDQQELIQKIKSEISLVAPGLTGT